MVISAIIANVNVLETIQNRGAIWLYHRIFVSLI